MARVVAFIPDLLFGSNVVGALSAAGHEVQLVSDPGDAAFEEVDVLVVDLTADAAERIARVARVAPVPAGDRPKVRRLAFYSHVETYVREQAQAAGFDLVIPRSRMAREGAAVVASLAEQGQS